MSTSTVALVRRSKRTLLPNFWHRNLILYTTICATFCVTNTMIAFQEGLFENVCNYPHIQMIIGSYSSLWLPVLFRSLFPISLCSFPPQPQPVIFWYVWICLFLHEAAHNKVCGLCWVTGSTIAVEFFKCIIIMFIFDVIPDAVFLRLCPKGLEWPHLWW